MFGKHGVYVDPAERDRHFSQVARRFALDAKMLRRKAAVHLESKNDIPFWSMVLSHYCPNDSFHFVTVSQNEFGKLTTGVTQCLKFMPYLSKDFFICIDSDYRYLLGDKRVNVGNFVLQTYTYSFENHFCNAKGLNRVCEDVTRSKNEVFDFEFFLHDYSRRLYKLFLYHLYLMHFDQHLFSMLEFSDYMNLVSDPHKLTLARNGEEMLERLSKRVQIKLRTLRMMYPEINWMKLKNHYLNMGVTETNCYLYMRGHNMYDMIELLCREVCKTIFRKNRKGKYGTTEAIRELYQKRHLLDEYLYKNLNFQNNPPILLLDKDIHQLFSPTNAGAGLN